MGFVYAAVVGVAMLAGTEFIGKVPTFILGGLLIYVGMDFLVDWLWKSYREFPLADYVVILVILVVIGTVGILEGVAFGFAIAVVLFVISYSRLSVVKTETSGRDCASNVDRDLATRELLNQNGEQVMVLCLQGFLFFGTINQVVDRVQSRVAESAPQQLRYLVLDFLHVSQLDISAIRAFAKIRQLAMAEGFHIVITGLVESMRHKLEKIDFFGGSPPQMCRMEFPRLDDGVAWCEEMILSETRRTDSLNQRSLQAALLTICGDQGTARDMAPYFVEVSVPKGTYLFRRGEPGDSLYLIGVGSVAVLLDTDDGDEIVLRRYRAGAIFGEMSLYTGKPRSAGVRTEEDVVLYRLDADRFETMQNVHGKAAATLHTYIIRLLAERVERANRERQRYL
jgi:SulP family sulfate permease